MGPSKRTMRSKETGENLVRIGLKGRITRELRLGILLLQPQNQVRRATWVWYPKLDLHNFHHPPETPCRTCFNCNRLGYFAKDYRVVPRNVNPVNARNPTTRACYECGSIDHIKAACPRLNQAQRPGENHQNQVVAVNEASGDLVEIDKVIKGCKLEIEGHVFDINLIPFRSGSFDVIIGIDWLSDHKAKIICHEKVVRIPLPNDKVLRVIRERPEEKMRHVMSAKGKEQKQEEIVVVRDFLEVFPDDLSGLPPIREIEFQIELVPGLWEVTVLLDAMLESHKGDGYSYAYDVEVREQEDVHFARTFEGYSWCNARTVLALPELVREDFVVAFVMHQCLDVGCALESALELILLVLEGTLLRNIAISCSGVEIACQVPVEGWDVRILIWMKAIIDAYGDADLHHIMIVVDGDLAAMSLFASCSQCLEQEALCLGTLNDTMITGKQKRVLRGNIILDLTQGRGLSSRSLPTQGRELSLFNRITASAVVVRCEERGTSPELGELYLSSSILENTIIANRKPRECESCPHSKLALYSSAIPDRVKWQ
ncbi:putative reverse transcriptase domain-containing protein [Tanacetum coccineum]